MDFLQHLIERKLVEKINIDNEEYYRIAGTIEFIIPAEKLSILKLLYEKHVEKGGILYSSIQKAGKKTVFRVEEIVLVPNVSCTPDCCYEYDRQLFFDAIVKAFARNLLPLVFHTHPTQAPDVIEEARAYHFQMETSEGDHAASLISHAFTAGRLRLPEVLVINSSSLLKGTFVGLYGGLVAPLKFSTSKNRVLYQYGMRQFLEFFGSITDFDDGLVKIGGSLLTMAIAKKHPEKTRRVLNEVHALLSPHAYALQEKPRYFAVSNGRSLVIECPKPDDLLLFGEERIVKLKNGISFQTTK